MSIDRETLTEMESTARKAAQRTDVCCLLHADCAENVIVLVAEVRRLQKLERAVAEAWESTRATLSES